MAANLYRMDFRSPAELKAAGGLVSRAPNGGASVIDHVKATPGIQDPWVGTTNDKKLAQAGAKSPGNVYVYYINPSGLTIVDTIREFQKAKQTHPHPGEKEFAIKRIVPWNNIVQWETFKMGKQTDTTTREAYEKNPKGSSPQPGSSSSKPGSSSPKKSPPRRRSIRSFSA